MITVPFILDERFKIAPSLNLIHDTLLGKECRLEARLMNLLCLLAANNGRLVSREMLTKEIWDNYGNADESLTQAVSYLRKILGDEQKQLIETIPKKGYVLHANISEQVIQKEAPFPPNQAAKSKLRNYVPAVVSVIFIFAVMLFLVSRSINKEAATGPDIRPGSDMVDRNADRIHTSNESKSPDVLNSDSNKNAGSTMKIGQHK